MRRADDPIRLPFVIRPTPVRLDDIERRVRHVPALATALRERPDLCGALARAILAHDVDSRRRFGDPQALTAHLRSLLDG